MYKTRGSLHNGADLLTDRQNKRLSELFAADERHAAVEVTRIYQRMIAAYRDTDPTTGKDTITALINSITTGIPAGLPEIGLS